MTADQIALANLEWVRLQTVVTALAIVVGPLVGVLFTLWAQGRKERQDAKTKLFMSLLGHRKMYFNYPPDVISAMNSIDVVFVNNENVRGLWHKYYGLLSLPPGEARGHAWLELLAEMAKDLGHKQLTQVDLDKFYMPQGTVDDAEVRGKVMRELHRVLESTATFLVSRRTEEMLQAAAGHSERNV